MVALCVRFKAENQVGLYPLGKTVGQLMPDLNEKLAQYVIYGWSNLDMKGLKCKIHPSTTVSQLVSLNIKMVEFQVKENDKLRNALKLLDNTTKQATNAFEMLLAGRKRKYPEEVQKRLVYTSEAVLN